MRPRMCPFPGCNTRIPAERFSCPHHWFGLSKDQKARIWAAYRGWLKGRIDGDELRRAQAEVVEAATREECNQG